MKLFCTLFGWALLLMAAAAPNPYENIAVRNVFNLVPPKLETSKPGDVFKPSPQYQLTGIAGFGSNKWALFSKADPGKAPQQFMMREGQREGTLEILQIDENANLVRIRNEGSLVELSFATNALPPVDLATRKFVDEHTRAHELHEQQERIRRERERGHMDGAVEHKINTLSPPQQAILESRR